MEVKVLDPKHDLTAWQKLYKASATDFTSFRGFKEQAERLFRGDYLVLKNRFRLTRFGCFKNGTLVGVAIHFVNLKPDSGPSSSLGGLLFEPQLSQEDLRNFATELRERVPATTVLPFNGHMTLGLSHPDQDVLPEAITFLCAPQSSQTTDFFFGSGQFVPSRRLHALVTPISLELRHQVNEGVRSVEERGFDSRPLSLIHYKRDILIYNQLVNSAMAGHPNFSPLTPEEEWDVLKSGAFIFKPNWFRFLIHEDREIGFCFALPDYNAVLRSSSSDVINAGRVVRARLQTLFGRGFKRARLVYSGVRPEYQGQGLFKAVRHRVIQEMINDGVAEFESSYVDEGNQASLGNVRSTGGRLSHSFTLYTFN